MQYVVQVGNYSWLSTFNGNLCLTTSGTHAGRHDIQVAEALAKDFLSDTGRVLANSALTAAYAKLAPSLPVTVVPAHELDFRLNAARSDRGEVKPAAEYHWVGKQARPGPKPVKNGVTRQIYQWVLDHPEATKADALAAFPSANPSTVGVQFGAARKALRG